MSNHWVYVIREDLAEFLKIGRAGSADRIVTRLKQSQVGCPSRLSVIATFPPGKHPGEVSIHKELSEYRLRPDGEWFIGADKVYEHLGIARPATFGDLEEVVARAFSERRRELDCLARNLDSRIADVDRCRRQLYENLNAMQAACRLIADASSPYFRRGLPDSLTHIARKEYA